MKRQYALLSLFIFLIVIACSNNKNRLLLLADNVNGLSKGSMVKMRGVDVGHVSKLKLLDKGVVVEINLNSDVRVPTGSTCYILYRGFGEAWVSIEPVTTNTAYYTQADTIPCNYKQQKILDELLSDSSRQRKIVETLDTFLEAMRKITMVKDSARQ